MIRGSLTGESKHISTIYKWMGCSDAIILLQMEDILDTNVKYS